MGLDVATSDSVVAKNLRRERGGTLSSWFEREAVPIPFQITFIILGYVCEVGGKEEKNGYMQRRLHEWSPKNPEQQNDSVGKIVQEHLLHEVFEMNMEYPDK